MADLRYVTVTETEWKAMADEIDRLRARIDRLRAIIEPLRALEAAAIPGPWWREWNNADDHDDGIDILASGHGGRVALVEDSEFPGTRETGFGPAAIADMICAARNALPALLREIQEVPDGRV